MQTQIIPWLIFTCCGTAAGILWFFLADRRKHRDGKSMRLSLMIAVSGLLLGAFCARGLWVLFWIFMHPAFFVYRLDELSYYGGMAGVILAVVLSARAVGRKISDTLYIFAPAGAMIAAVFRFAEGFLGTLGFGKYLEHGVFFPVTVEVFYDQYYSEYYWAVFMLEGVLALAAMALSVLHRKPDRFLWTLFWLCLPQILCESLRIQSIRWLFVRCEQLTCFLVCEGLLVWYAFRHGARRFRSWIPALVGLAVCGLVIAVEFALDGKILVGGRALSHPLLYGIMAAGLAMMAAAEHKSRLCR